MIRPYLRDLINEHMPTMELNINNNSNSNNNSKNSNSNNNSKNSNNNNNDIDPAEWKIQLTMQISCISARNLYG